jgi:hypothetical protein
MYDSHDARDESGELRADWDSALRTGLRDLPTPQPSPDFDARVFQRLARPEPLRDRIRALARGMRPALAAAGVTAPCALLLVMWLARTPGGAIAAPLSGASAPSRAAEALPVEQALEKPDLTPATLRRLSRQEAAVRGRSGRTAGRASAA